MRRLGTVCTILLLAGCTAQGAIAPNLGERLLAGITCTTALAGAGLAVYDLTQPSTAAARQPTAVDVLNKINTVGTSNVPVTVLAACAETINNAVADAQGIRAKVKGATVPDPKLIKN